MTSSSNIDGVGAVLKRYQHIKVADYQRNYDWGREQLEELFGDIESVVEKDRKHFFGCLILQETAGNSCEIVDGQQRITTLFLIMARIRNAINEIGLNMLEPSAAGERNIYVLQIVENFIYGDAQTATSPRFEANSLLKNLNKQLLSGLQQNKSKKNGDGGDDREATRAMRRAYKLIGAWLDEELNELETPQEKLRRLHGLSVAILDKLTVLPILTADRDESLSVFMTINDRGMPLGVFDLVRSQILTAQTATLSESKIETLFQESLADWAEILENIEGAKPDQFLRHFLLSHVTGHVTTKSVTQEVDRIVRYPKDSSTSRRPVSATEQAKNAARLWAEIEDAAQVYSQILNPTDASPLRDKLRVLRLVADSYRIPLLTFLAKDTKLSKANQAEFLRLLCIGVLRWNMAGKNAQDLESELQAIGHDAKTSVPAARARLRKLAQTEVDIPRFLSEGVSTQWAKAILWLLESELSAKAAPIAMSALHLEHVAPRTPEPKWERRLKTDKTYRSVVNDIGNFTLLDTRLNTGAKRELFERKTSEFFKKSRIALSRDLCRLRTWDASVIEQRRIWIGRCLEQILQVSPEKPSPFSKEAPRHMLTTRH